jgi:hypothetical protein
MKGRLCFTLAAAFFPPQPRRIGGAQRPLPREGSAALSERCERAASPATGAAGISRDGAASVEHHMRR